MYMELNQMLLTLWYIEFVWEALCMNKKKIFEKINIIFTDNINKIYYKYIKITIIYVERKSISKKMSTSKNYVN